MKKLFSLVLALCMACMTIPAIAEESVAGVWYTRVLDTTLVLTLAEDGSAELSVPGTDTAGTGSWALEGEKLTLTFNGASAEGVFADGRITLEGEDGTMVFMNAEMEGISPAEVNPAAAAEDFEGTWRIVYVGYGRIVMDADSTEEELLSLQVENGAVLFTGDRYMSMIFGSRPLQLTYADGRLGISHSAGSGSFELRLEMLEDGMLALTADLAGREVSMYFVKAVAEEPAAGN